MKPLAVCTSDIHFNLANLELATASLQAAINKANELKVPLIIAGDLHDTKAIIRAEVANRLIGVFQANNIHYGRYLLIGNHDLINEKSVGHSLNFLHPYIDIIDESTHLDHLDLWLLPYFSDKEDLIKFLGTVPLGSKLIMHQGFMGAAMGDYVLDKSSISPDLVKDFTVISGHYHRHQQLTTKHESAIMHPYGIGTITYIGSPYTMSFGEANDGPKGFLILNEDGSFTREILNLRKHVVLNITTNELYDYTSPDSISAQDLVWLKLSGPRSELDKIDKNTLGNRLFGRVNFKLDLVPTESEILSKKVNSIQLVDHDLLDHIIDLESDSEEYKIYLKRLSREITQS